MAEYKVKDPSGKVRVIAGPDGASDEEIIAQAQKLFAPKAKAPAEKPLDPTADMNWLQKGLAGFGKSIVDTERGLVQLGEQAANKLGRTSDARLQAVNASVDEAERLDKPLMDTGAGMAGNIIGQGVQYALPAGAVMKAPKILAAAKAAPMLTSAAGGAAFAGSQPVTSDDSRLENMAWGAGGAAVGAGAAKVIGAAARGSSTMTPKVEALAERAKALGIDIRADQLVKSKPVQAMRAAAEYMPFSGIAKQDAGQIASLNRRLAGSVGEQTDDMAEALTRAKLRLGNEFERVLTTTDVKFDRVALDRTFKALGEAQDSLSQEQFSRVSKQVGNILDKVDEAGNLPAQAAYGVKKQLDALSKSGDRDVGHHAREIREALADALNRTLGPDEAAKFALTRRQYANMSDLKKLVPAGAEPKITAARLAQAKERLKSPELKELADIAGQFMKRPIGDSGTMPRTIGAAVIGGAAGLGSLGSAIVGGRLTASALNSKWLAEYLKHGNAPLKAVRPVTDYVLPKAGAIGGLLSN